MLSNAKEMPQRCPAIRKDGKPCQAQSNSSGFCVGHSPAAQDARRRGGAATSRASRAGKLLPSRLRPVVALLEKALGEVHEGKLDPRVATAMASLAGALVRVYQSGEMEERLRVLEESAA